MAARSIAVYFIPGHEWSRKAGEAMAEGIRRCGDRAHVMPVTEHRGADHAAAVFWGFIEPCQRVMSDYRAAGKAAVYIDSGYWGRGKDGYCKVAVNSRHPTAYFQRRKHDHARAAELGIKPSPYRSGSHILVAGMSAKAAWAEKLEPVESFERRCIDVLRTITDRPIVYRPKPTWKAAKPIEGVRYSAPEEPLSQVLADCHAVVTHHSNVAVDGLVAGVPAFCLEGVALPMSLQDVRLIEHPRYQDGREQWIADVAWCQFNVAEMRDGVAWRHLKDEGLMP